MAQNRSFKDYVANRFYNELYDAVSSYLEQNHRDLDVSSRLVHTIDSTELSHIDIKNVFVDNLPGYWMSPQHPIVCCCHYRRLSSLQD